MSEHLTSYLNSLPNGELLVQLARCCASRRWTNRVAAHRPFCSESSLLKIAADIWWTLGEEDWREAFAAHPRIGDLDTESQDQCAGTQHWAASEQAGAAAAAPETILQLAEANRAYEQQFGYIFIVCATGKTAEEMLELLRKRTANAAPVEIRVAAAEQLKITQLRLRKLIS